MIDTSPDVDRFRHQALFYSGWPEFIAGTVPFIREGLAAGEPVLVVESQEKIKNLRVALDHDADSVFFADMSTVGANPARIIPAWRDFVDKQAVPGKGLRGIGEPIWSTRGADELVECQRHEALLNVAFGHGRAWSLLCPYDTSNLGPAVLDEARRSHEFIIEGDSVCRSEQFRGIDACGAPFSVPLPSTQGHVEEATFEKHGLRDLRALVARAATAAGLGPSKTSMLATAANEVATNSVVHGGGRGKVRVWVDGDRVICEIRDRGVFDRPLVDREAPGPDASTARGLWLVNQLCDLVQIRSLEGETAVRLHMRLDPRANLRLMPGLTSDDLDVVN